MSVSVVRNLIAWSVAQGIVTTQRTRLPVTPGPRPDCRSAAMGSAANSRRAHRAIHRAHNAERCTWTLSVEMPGIGVHLAIQLGDEHERQPRGD